MTWKLDRMGNNNLRTITKTTSSLVMIVLVANLLLYTTGSITNTEPTVATNDMVNLNTDTEKNYDTLGKQHSTNSLSKLTKTPPNTVEKSNVQSSSQSKNSANEKYQRLITENPEKNTNLRALKTENLDNLLNPLAVPSTPPDLTTTPISNAQIQITWSTPFDGGSPITYYNIHRETALTFFTFNIMAPTTLINHTGLSPRTEYCYKIRAENSEGYSGFSSNVCTTTFSSPDAPTLQTISTTDTSVTITWDPPSYNGGSTILSYTIENSTNGGMTYSVFALGVSTLTYTAPNLNKGVAYHFRVRAVNAYGTGAPSNSLFETIAPTIPGAPTLQTISTTDTNISITWAAPSDNGGFPSLNYTIENSIQNESAYSVFAMGVTTLTYTVPNLNKGVTYYFRIRAVNNIGTGTPSNSLFEIVAITIPGTPTGLLALASGTTITVSWTVPVDTGGLAITYILSRLDPDGSFTNITTSETSYTDSGLNKSSTYTYKVLTTNTFGDSAFTSSVSATIATTAPDVPTGLTALASGTTITVSWTAPADTGGLAITYILSRLDPDGSLTNITTSETSYTDSGLNKSSTYTYKVLTSNTFGDSAFTSSVSATIATTAPDVPTGLTALASGTTITVSWTAPADTGGLAITYILSRLDPDGSFTNITTSETSYTDSGLNKSSTYTYKVLTTNTFGDSAFTSSVSATIATTAPGVPTGLMALASGTTITVSWTAPADTGGLAITYILSRLDPDGSLTNITTSETSYTDSGLNKSSTYTYKVLTSNTFGDSAFTSSVSATIATTAPGVPTGLMALASGTTITVSWTAPADTGGLAITYILSRLDPDGSFTNITTSETSYTDSGLNKSSTYTYKVLTTNTFGDSAFTSSVSATIATTAPDVPTGLTALASGTTITVSWTAPADTGGLAITYILSRLDPDGSLTNITTSETSYTDSGLNKSSTYTYKVLTSNTFGDSAFTSSVSATIATTAPDVPTGLTALASGTTITVSWTAPADTGGLAITYILSRLDPDGSFTNITTSETSYTDSGLNKSSTYTYKVLTTNTFGDSAFTSSVSATIATTAPDVPTGLTALASGTTITVSWTAPADTGGLAITYILSRLDPDGSLTNITTSETSYTDSGLNKSSTYTYKVLTSNTFGDSAFTSSVSATIATTAPDVPTGLTALASGTTITVSWTAPADTGGLAITYILSRLDPDGSFTNITTSETSYTDSGLNKSSTYTYKVLTTNTFGDSAFTSSVSATIATTAPDVPTGLMALASGTTITVSWTAPADTGSRLAITYILSRLDPDGSLTNITTSETSYTDSGLNKSSTYTYKVLTSNTFGDSAFTSSVSATIATTAPDVPTGLMALASGTTITVSWTAPADTGGLAITYILSRLDPDGSFTNITTSETSYTDSGLNKSSTYTYKVLTTNTFGDSAFTSSVSATIATTAPGVPTGLMALASGTTITVSWTAPADTGGLAITYILSRLDPDGSFTNITTSETSYTDSGLNKSSTYTYKVLTTNTFGDSAFTSSVSATIATTAPDVPTGLTALASGTTITVSWTAPVDTGGLTITYILSRLDPDGSFTNITTSETSYTDSGLNKSSTYTYKVLTSNTFGDSAFTSSVSATIATTAPDVPTGLMALASGTTITVSWTAPADTGGLAITYILSRLDPDGSFTNITTSETSYTDSGLNKSSTYTYKVLTSNTFGDSAFTSSVSATIATTAPGVPTGLTALASGTAITVSWTAPVDTGGLTITYILSRLDPDGSFTNITTSETSYTDSGLNKSSTYTYKVLTTNTFGDSAFTFSVSATIATTIPGVPTDLTLSASDTTVTVSWTAPVDTGGLSVTYTLARSENSGVFSNISTNQAEVNYVDSNLNKSSTYTYQVVARNNDGDSAFTTLQSATIATTVPGVPTNLMVSASGTTITVSWTAPVDTGGSSPMYTIARSENSGAFINISISQVAVNYVDSNLNKGSIYNYQVVAKNSVGDSAFTTPEPVTVATTVPDVPTELTVSASGTTITVSWTAPIDTGGLSVTYTLARSENNGAFINISTSQVAVNYVDSNLNKGSTYRYQVTAQNSIGDSTFTVPESATIATTIAGIPTDLTVSVSGTTITVSWVAPSDTGGLSVTYTVARSENGGGFTNISTSQAEVNYVDSNLNKSSTYTYQVATKNSVGDSAFTAPESETISTTVPDVPTGLTATASDTTITVTWTAPVDTGGLLVTYILSRSEAGGVFTNFTTSTTTYTDSGLNKGLTYTYKVLTNNSLGESAFIPSVSESVLATVSGIPLNFVLLSANATVVELSWTAPDDAGGSPIMNYTVERSTDSGSFTILVAGLTTTSFNDTTVVKGTTYSYRTHAVNSVGSSAPSSVQVVEIETTIPSIIASTNKISELGLTTLLNWTVTDTNPSVYNITRNGTSVRGNTAWVSGSVLNYTTSATLAVGVYNFTAYFVDAFDNVATSSVLVTIEDTTVPSIPAVADKAIELKTGTTLTWKPTDSSSGTYNITRNGEAVVTDTEWSLDTDITFSVPDSLAPGSYNYTVIVKDSSGNVASSSTIVIVQDTTKPEFLTVPSDRLDLALTDSELLEWTATDLDPAGYTIFKNGEIVKTGTWAVGQPISFVFSGQLAGNYNYTLKISDGSGNFAVDEVLVTVTRTGGSVTETPTSSSDSSMQILENRFAQAVVVWGGVFLILLIAFIILFLLRRRRNKHRVDIITYE